jgi:hypothetical protein
MKMMAENVFRQKRMIKACISKHKKRKKVPPFPDEAA